MNQRPNVSRLWSCCVLAAVATAGCMDEEMTNPVRTALTVVGTDGDSQERVVIDCSQNGGLFQVSWKTRGNTEYEANLNLYRRSGPSTGSLPPQPLFEEQCGPNYSCGQEVVLQCFFDCDNRLSCGDGPWVDLTNWLNSLPEELAMQLRTMESDGSWGWTSEQEILLR